MPQLEEATDAFADNPTSFEDGRHIAYARILTSCSQFAISPRFLREDCAEIANDAELSSSVPKWMNTAAHVSIGGKVLVLEDGPDTINSDDEESTKEEHGEVLTGMSVGDLKQPATLSQSEAARQKAIATAIKGPQAPPRAQSPASPSSVRVEARGSGLPRSSSSSYFPDPSTVRSEVETSGPHNSPKPAPAPRKGKGGSRKGSKDLKAVTRPADHSESSHPMVTRRKASGAGGLRPEVGSGQTDTCVPHGHPSKT
jgi:hypothetical protein